jgi:phosphoesterase RecJ-like protein
MIQSAQKITLLTHYNPDGDGVSACAALDHILRAAGKQVETVYPTALKTPLNRQPARVLINRHEQTPDLIIICDTANYERLYNPAEFATIPSINIDHHASTNIKPTINFVDAQAPSTCDLLYRLLMMIDPALIDQRVADCLLFGIMYDTQSFSIQSTSAKVLRIAADLIDQGAAYVAISQELKFNKNQSAIKLWGAALANVTFNKEQTAAWIVVKQKDLRGLGLQIDALSGLENFIAQLAIADVTMFFYEDELGRSRVSFRGKRTDVNVVAQKFGGGGHKFAAGLMSNITLDELVPQVTACFE